MTSTGTATTAGTSRSDSITYKNVKLEDGRAGNNNGSLTVGADYILFKCTENGGDNGKSKQLKLKWERVAKCQISPAKHPTPLLKVVSQNDKAKTFQIEDRDTLVKIQKDIKRRLAAANPTSTKEKESTGTPEKGKKVTNNQSTSNIQETIAKPALTKSPQSTDSPSFKTPSTSPSPAPVSDNNSPEKKQQSSPGDAFAKRRARTSVAASKPGAVSMHENVSLDSNHEPTVPPVLRQSVSVGSGTTPSTSSTQASDTAMKRRARSSVATAAMTPGAVAVTDAEADNRHSSLSSSEPSGAPILRESVSGPMAFGSPSSSHASSNDAAFKRRARGSVPAIRLGAVATRDSNTSNHSSSSSEPPGLRQPAPSLRSLSSDAAAKRRGRSSVAAIRPGAVAASSEPDRDARARASEPSSGAPVVRQSLFIHHPNGAANLVSSSAHSADAAIKRRSRRSTVTARPGAVSVRDSVKEEEGASDPSLVTAETQRRSGSEAATGNGKDASSSTRRSLAATSAAGAHHEQQPAFQAKELLEQEKAKSQNRRVLSKQASLEPPPDKVESVNMRHRGHSDVGATANDGGNNNDNNSNNEGYLVEAMLVEDDSNQDHNMTAEDRAKLEEETRERVMKEMMVDAAEAVIVEDADPKEIRRQLCRKRCICIFFLFLIVAVILGSVLGTPNSKESSSGPSVITLINNDNCSSALPIALRNETYAATTEGATMDDAPACEASSAPTGPGVWYKVQGKKHLIISANTCNSTATIDTQVAVFNGSCGGDNSGDLLECIVGNDGCGGVTWNATEGEDYYIFVHGATAGTFVLDIESWRLSPTDMPPSGEQSQSDRPPPPDEESDRPPPPDEESDRPPPPDEESDRPPPPSAETPTPDNQLQANSTSPPDGTSLPTEPPDDRPPPLPGSIYPPPRPSGGGNQSPPPSRSLLRKGTG